MLPNRRTAALAVRRPSAADGARGRGVRGGLEFEADGRLVSADSLRAALSSAIKDEDVMGACRASE